MYWWGVGRGYVWGGVGFGGHFEGLGVLLFHFKGLGIAGLEGVPCVFCNGDGILVCCVGDVPVKYVVMFIVAKVCVFWGGAPFLGWWRGR